MINVGTGLFTEHNTMKPNNSNKGQTNLSTKLRHETPSWPPTAYIKLSNTATPTLVLHELVGATSLLH